MPINKTEPQILKEIQILMTVPIQDSSTVFREWEECHSASKLMEHAVQHHEEAQKIDGLLVSGAAGAPRLAHSSRNTSLTKFLSQSLVFQKRCTEAQRAAGMALCKSFGWAPQRYISRAHPMSLAQRRWDPIWDTLEEEALGKTDRAAIARYFIAELGGENSRRLLFGGMLTDIAVEHYKWVAGGDKGQPDPSTVMAGLDVFLERLKILFDEGMVLTLRESYTGEVLQFLEKGKTIQYQKQIQTCGLGRLSDVAVKEVVAQALQQARELVAIIRAQAPVFRNKTSWLHAFTAFRLPSPLSQAALARDTQAQRAEHQQCVQEIHASLDRIRKAAKLDEEAMKQLLKLLPRAEVHRKSGCSTKEAWGRASAEFPEYKNGRDLVDVFLLWKPNTGNLERRFRYMKEHRPAERSSLADTTVENMLSVDFAPPSEALAAAAQAATDPSTVPAEVQGAQSYLKLVLRLHTKLHNAPQRRPQQNRKQRRDAGVAKTKEELDKRRAKSGAPLTEAAHSRKRTTAIDALVHATPAARSEARDRHVLGSTAASVAGESVAVPAAVQEKINKRQREAVAAYEQAEKRVKKAKAKNPVVGAFVKAGGKFVEEKDSADAGVVLIPGADRKLREFLVERKFKKILNDPIEFADAVVAMRAKVPSRGHLVIVPHGLQTNYAVAARLAAVLLGTHMATAEDYQRKGVSSGCQFRPSYNAEKSAKLKLAVSPRVATEFPSASALLRHISQLAGSRMEFHRDAKALVRKIRRSDGNKESWKTSRIFGKQDERMEEKPKYQNLYSTGDELLRLLQIAVPRSAAAAPGITVFIECIEQLGGEGPLCRLGGRSRSGRRCPNTVGR